MWWKCLAPLSNSCMIHIIALNNEMMIYLWRHKKMLNWRFIVAIIPFRPQKFPSYHTSILYTWNSSLGYLLYADGSICLIQKIPQTASQQHLDQHPKKAAQLRARHYTTTTAGTRSTPQEMNYGLTGRESGVTRRLRRCSVVLTPDVMDIVQAADLREKPGKRFIVSLAEVDCSWPVVAPLNHGARLGKVLSMRI